MKSVVSAFAILAFTAGTAAAGCGMHSSEVADKDADRTKSESVASTSGYATEGTTAESTDAESGEQVAKTPSSDDEGQSAE